MCVCVCVCVCVIGRGKGRQEGGDRDIKGSVYIFIIMYSHSFIQWQVVSNRPHSPSYSFGIKHSEYIMVM